MSYTILAQPTRTFALLSRDSILNHVNPQHPQCKNVLNLQKDWHYALSCDASLLQNTTPPWEIHMYLLYDITTTRKYAISCCTVSGLHATVLPHCTETPAMSEMTQRTRTTEVQKRTPTPLLIHTPLLINTPS